MENILVIALRLSKILAVRGLATAPVKVVLGDKPHPSTEKLEWRPLLKKTLDQALLRRACKVTSAESSVIFTDPGAG